METINPSEGIAQIFIDKKDCMIFL